MGDYSDIHDNIWSLERVLARLVDCDQLCRLATVQPFTLAAIGAGFNVRCIPYGATMTAISCC